MTTLTDTARPEALATMLSQADPLVWLNPAYRPAPDAAARAALEAAAADWAEIAPLIAAVFPETAPTGTITSPLLPIPPRVVSPPQPGAEVFLKADHALPVAGSVKARGGLFEVLCTATAQARAAGLLAPGETTARLASPQARAFFAQRTISVGSTGNLGLSIGIAARALGYRAIVHMSADAKPWKVARLTDLGVEVVQHAGDFSSAVAAAREAAARDPACHFVDDEDSPTLFHGYSAAALEIADQLAAQGLEVSADRPLCVYLPCGVGGAPGGIAHGLRGVFGPHVHAFLCEPVQAPSGLCRLAFGRDPARSVYGLGLTNRTEADGMAVASFSEYVAGQIAQRVAGAFTVSDDALFAGLQAVHDHMGERLEPSAAAALGGPARITSDPAAAAFRARHLDGTRPLHIVWATGGQLVPDAQYAAFLDAARLRAAG